MADDRSVSNSPAASSAAAPGSPASHSPSLSPTPPSLFGAEALEPALHQACGDRLSPITWFRTDWQRGGALTGYASWRQDRGGETPVVVKLPVAPVERRWLMVLQASPNVVPKLHAEGETLGSFDLAWVVMERLPYGPLGTEWGGEAFDLLIEALVRFNAAAREVPLTDALRQRDYRAIREESRENIHRHGVAHEQRWNKALKHAQRHLNDWLKTWGDRPTDQWCHGDVHLGNAMTRVAPPQGPALLLDFAEVHRGHWVEDAVHFEHLYWARRDRLEGRKVCKLIARQRKAIGLPVDEEWNRLACVYRALLAMSTPAILRHTGDPHHVEAALAVLEQEVG